MEGVLMSYIPRIDNFQSVNYSSNNKYAQEYSNAYRKLDDVRFKAANCKDPKVLDNLLKQLEYLENKVSNISEDAQKEENKLQASNNNPHCTIDYMA